MGPSGAGMYNIYSAYNDSVEVYAYRKGYQGLVNKIIDLPGVWFSYRLSVSVLQHNTLCRQIYAAGRFGWEGQDW